MWICRNSFMVPKCFFLVKSHINSCGVFSSILMCCNSSGWFVIGRIIFSSIFLRPPFFFAPHFGRSQPPPNHSWVALITPGYSRCCNLSRGLVTKARAWEVAGQEGSPGVTSHAPRSAKECKGMNPHTPKWTPILGVGVPMDSRISRGQL
jgi:hypothetical protein